MKKVITILSISLLVLGGCTTTQVAEVENTIEQTTVKETMVKGITVKETIIETTTAEETTVAEESVSDEIKTLMEKYNGKHGNEIKWDAEDKNNAEYLKSKGYVLICLNTDNDKDVVFIKTKEEAKKIYEDAINSGDRTKVLDTSTNYLSSEVLNEVIKNADKKKSQAQAEAFSSEVSSHIKSGSGVATVINDLNPYGYTTNNLGYVVQNEQAVAHMNSLKGNESNLYRKTELEVFKKNNAGKVTVRDNVKVEYNGSQGTFNGDGFIMWICREPNFMTTDALGRTMYAHCNYGYEEFREYCGGTTTAFMGWGEDKCDPYGQKNWCDAHNLLDKNLSQFVDSNYAWIGADGERKYKKLY